MPTSRARSVTSMCSIRMLLVPLSRGSQSPGKSPGAQSGRWDNMLRRSEYRSHVKAPDGVCRHVGLSAGADRHAAPVRGRPNNTATARGACGRLSHDAAAASLVSGLAAMPYAPFTSTGSRPMACSPIWAIGQRSLMPAACSASSAMPFGSIACSGDHGRRHRRMICRDPNGRGVARRGPAGCRRRHRAR